MALFGFGRRRVLDGDSGYRSGRMLLTSPSTGVFGLSLIFAAVALVIRYTDVRVPIVNASYVFEVLLIAYAILCVSILAGGRRGL